MRRSRVLPLVSGLCLVLGASALAESPKPLAVLSLSGYDHAKSAVESVGFVKDAREMPTWLSSMFRLYAEGRALQGLDPSRPWGAAILCGDKPTSLAFVPVADAETLANELHQYIEETTEVGDGVYKVVGTEPGKQLYAKPSGGWLFVADCAECLANVPADPTALLDGMNKQYDVAVRLTLTNVSEDMRKKALSRLDKAFGSALRELTSPQTVEIVGKAALALDEVTLGWAKR